MYKILDLIFGRATSSPRIPIGFLARKVVILMKIVFRSFRENGHFDQNYLKMKFFWSYPKNPYHEKKIISTLDIELEEVL